MHRANEAGKSTALAAVADAACGFGHRTDATFCMVRRTFGSASHSRRDGAIARFVRRKGRRDTLRDLNDQAVPNDALRRFLGGASRDLFERGFGLDGARLREGGCELPRIGGEVGGNLLAGAGLLNLRTAWLGSMTKSPVDDGRDPCCLSDAVDA